MARSDLLITLFRAGSEGDEDLFRRTAEAIIAEEKAKKHTIFADRLSTSLSTPRRRPGSAAPKAINGASHASPASAAGRDFLHVIEPRRGSTSAFSITDPSSPSSG